MTGLETQRTGPLAQIKNGMESLGEGWHTAKQIKHLSTAGKLHSAMDYTSLAHTRGITASEYFYQYCFYRLSKQEQQAFITIAEAQKITRRLSREIRDLFWHKDLFLAAFSDYIRRDWVWVKQGAREQFCALCRAHTRLIIKPRASTEGRGVRILEQGDMADPDRLFDQLLKENCIAEEILYGEPSIAQFHPASLNTIRVVTLYNGEDFEIFGAVIRFGTEGSVVDNASAGGIFAAVDAESGVVISDGLDMMGHRYDKHPDSNKAIKAFRVPCWDAVVDTVRAAVRVVPHIRLAGWDVAVLQMGGTALIEGNHMPDFDILQSPMQIGVRQAFMNKMREFFGDSCLT